MVSLSSLVGAEATDLAEALNLQEAIIRTNSDDHCSLATERFTLHFLRQPSDGQISSHIEIHAPPVSDRALSNCLHTWLILRSVGEPWPAQEASSQHLNSVAEELRRIKRALSAINDDQSLLRVLLWEAGYTAGYASWG